MALTRAMAVDEAAYGVRVNSITPGSVETPMLRTSAALFGDGTEAGAQRVVDNWGTAHALGRVATIAEVGEVISFLSSPRASSSPAPRYVSTAVFWRGSLLRCPTAERRTPRTTLPEASEQHSQEGRR